MVDGEIIRGFPEISQSNKIRADISYEFDETQDVYEITKGPVPRVFEVKTTTQSFVEGTDYSLIENDSGNITKIDWGIGGDSPSDGSLFIIDQEFQSTIYRYLESHDAEFNNLDDDVTEIISSRQVEYATGEKLDRIGALFGRLGKRSDRSDNDYRSYLKSVVESFSGRGSRAGLKFAISSAVGSDPNDVEIIENVEQLSYTVILRNIDTALISTSINELAELADPSGVQFDNAIIVPEGGEIEVDGSSTTITNETTGLGSNILTMDGNSTLT